MLASGACRCITAIPEAESLMAVTISGSCKPLTSLMMSAPARIAAFATRAFHVSTEIAISAPLAVVSTRATLRQGLVEAVTAAVNRESQEQDWQRRTEDFKEGVAAMAARREPVFQGR